MGSSGGRRAQFAAGMKGIELHERALLWRMLEGTDTLSGLRRLPNLTVHLDYEDLTKRDLIVSIGFQHLDPASAVKEYERRGVIVYERVTTSLYSKRMLESFGLSGAVRISPLHCHHADDIDKFLKVTAELSTLKNRLAASHVGDAATPTG